MAVNNKKIFFKFQILIFGTNGTLLEADRCLLQVFKLKGADRKHKQDKDKLKKKCPSDLVSCVIYVWLAF